MKKKKKPCTRHVYFESSLYNFGIENWIDQEKGGVHALSHTSTTPLGLVW